MTSNIYTNQEKYTLFKTIKNKNSTLENLAEIYSDDKINDLLFDKPLIFWSAMCENITITRFLLNHTNNSKYILDAFDSIYSNKNPEILEAILLKLSSLKDFPEHINHIVSKVSMNAFRDENIIIILNIMNPLLNSSQIENLVFSSFRNNNRKLIENMGKFEKLKSFCIENKDKILEEFPKKDFLFNSIINEKIYESEIKDNSFLQKVFELPKIDKTKNLNKNENKIITIPTIIKKKRRLIA